MVREAPAGSIVEGVDGSGSHLAIVGPTASGKSAVAMQLARDLMDHGVRVEIVSCDSMQVYRGMDIGTAKPSLADRAEVPHHLIDLVEPSEDHNLAMFIDEAREVVSGIESRGARAVLVGGTGLYVRGIVDDFTPPPHFPDITAELEAVEDTSKLTERLAELDPLGLSRIPPGNRRRIVRALEVSLGTGIPFSRHGTDLEQYGPTRFALVGLRPERDVLTRAIAQRYEEQMSQGFLEEVRVLASLVPPMSRTARQALGYRELLDHLDGAMVLEKSLETARVRTRKFAVRQLRWFGRDPRIVWVPPPGPGRSVGAVAVEIRDRWAAGSSGKLGVSGGGAAGTVGAERVGGSSVGPDEPGPRSRSDDS